MEQEKIIEVVGKENEESTFNKLKKLQELLNKESALKELCN